MTHREKQQRRAERLRGWADGRQAKAEAEYEQFQLLLDVIPPGQPILVGHHSEAGHRAHLARLDRAIGRSVEHDAKARDMRSRADNIEAAARSAIYNDDPDALDALREKLRGLEARREAMKGRNAAYRKAHRAELAGMHPFHRDRAMPHPSYELQNLGGTISRTRKRIAELSTPETPRVIVAKYAGECSECGRRIEKGESIRWFPRTRRVACGDGCQGESEAA